MTTIPVTIDELARTRDRLIADKRPQANVCQQLFDLSIGEACPVDTGRGTDAFDRGDTPEAGQPLRRNPADRTPSILEIVDFGDQRQDFRRDPDGRRI